jgi:transglutaminase-like putative cysteine protease
VASTDRASAASVDALLVFQLDEPAVIAVQVAVAEGIPTTSESLVVDLDGEAVEPIEVDGAQRSRIHVIDAGAGRLTVRYAATVATVDAPPPVELTLADRLQWLRQSRYCPSDLAEDFAVRELGELRGSPTSGRGVGRWVRNRLAYELGSSGPGDSAIDTLLAGRGVCRDFVHLTVTMCRALGIPARFVAAYAPGLSPMDFHAVAEVEGPDGWEIVDATGLAPRSSLIRIATGRDAADTALVTTLEGHAELLEASVTAFTLDDLPIDDLDAAVHLP